jgi:hypothetical protein
VSQKEVQTNQKTGEPKIENSEEHASTFFNKYNEFKNLPLYSYFSLSFMYE